MALTGCWSLSNSEGVSPEGHVFGVQPIHRVLVAFKQRRCFSERRRVFTPGLRGVGRFQTAKVFLQME